MNQNNIIVAITGASGAIYAQILLKQLQVLFRTGKVQDVVVVFSKNGADVWRHELGSTCEMGFRIYENNNFNVPFASGSSNFNTMIVCPCSMGTMGRIAHGLSDTLITRAADVMLKERRRLILAIRETPVNLIHINNMQELTKAGAIIAPASPSFYSHPQTIDELAATVTNRLLQLAGLDVNAFRWGEA